MKTLVFTGGHHNSSLPVAQALKNEGTNIVWLGHRHSQWGDTSDSAEYHDVTAAGITFFDLQAGKFYKTFHPAKLIRIPWGFIQAFYYLLKIRPQGIVSFGGYLAVPVVFAGWFLGIPSITHEQTVVAGWANRFLAYFVKKIAITWPESAAHFPKSKVVLTGLPLRPELVNLKSKPTTDNPQLKTLYITGGKQGSHVINSVVFDALPQLTKAFNVIHQTGTSSIYNDVGRSEEMKMQNYFAFGYDSKKAIEAFSKAEVVVSRAGAHTTYELLYLGLKCVLIPIPWVSHNEQLENAKLLEKQNLAVILSQDDLSVKNLLDAIAKCVSLTPQKITEVGDGLPKLIELIHNTFNPKNNT